MPSYATPADLVAFGIGAGAISNFTTQQQQSALDAASSLADGYLRSRYTLPITSASADLKRAVCAIAAFDLLTARGFNPENGSDSAIEKRYDDAMKWLKQVSDGVVSPELTDSTPGSISPAPPKVITNCKRGW